MQKLYDLDAAEVSLVPRGANKKKFLIFKNDGGDSMPVDTQDLLEEIKKSSPEALRAVEKVLKEYDMAMKANPQAGQQGQMPVVDERAMAALKAVARILAPFKSQITPELVNQVLKSIGIGADPNPGAGAGGAAQGDPNKNPNPQQQPVNKSATTDTEDEMPKEEILKADGTIDFSKVPENVRPVLEVIHKSHTDLVKQNKEIVQKNDDLEKQNKEIVQKNLDLEKKVSDQASAVREKEIVAKADSFTHLGIPKEDVVMQLKLADGAGKETFEKVCKNFEAISKQNKEGSLFKELGSNQPSGGTTNDAYEKIEKMAEAYVAKSSEKITKEAAMEIVMKTSEGQKLYAEYKSGRKDGI